MSIRAACLLCSVSLLVGCPSEFALGPDTGDLPGDDPGTTPVGGQSPWDDVRPSDLPEVYVAVGWSEDVCSPDRPAGDPLRCPLRFAVADGLGHVVAEVEVPEPAGVGVRLVGTDSGGPGRFLIRTEESVGGADLPTARVVREVNAGTGEQSELVRVARRGGEVRLEVGETGSTLPLDAFPGSLRAGASPVDAGRVLIALETADGVFSELIDVDLLGADHRRWSAEEITGIPDSVPVALADFQVSSDEEGRPLALMALRISPPGAALRQDLLVWSPTEGRRWNRPLVRPAGARLGWLGGDGGVALHLTREADGEDEEAEWGWRVEAEQGTSRGPTPADLESLELGALLDPAGPTFVALAADELFHLPDRLVVLHRGELVVDLPELRFGLEWRAGRLHSPARVPAPTE